MSVAYRTVQWSAYKKRYDIVLSSLIVSYLATFIIVGKLALRGVHAISDEILLMRALATCAFLMLNITLCIGPLARLDRRFLPLLYNRRHLGVATFLMGLLHALLSLGFYHGFGTISPLVSLLTSNTQYRSFSAFPFEILGMLSLIILFVMAATSHDFWLKNLSPGAWKSLHMLVYPAWAMLVLHVGLGAMQSEHHPLYSVLFIGIVVIVPTLHIVAGWREVRRDRIEKQDWIDVCPIDDISLGSAKIVTMKDRERIAIFHHSEGLSAISNVCAHQGGPLGEGRIVDGCITCPWHGYQYRPEDGCSPPPFTEKVTTYAVRIENGRVFVNTEACHVG